MNKQVVATIKDASQEEPQTIDLREMSIEDLLSLKTTDPFMYNSIPAVEKAARLLKNVDHQQIVDSVNHEHIASSTEDTCSFPQQVHPSNRLSSSIVHRKRRLSTESCPSLLVDDGLTEEDLQTLHDTTDESGVLSDLDGLVGLLSGSTEDKK